jgi:hypothetical protein
MKPYRPILTQHRFRRLVLWALTLLHWIAAMLSGARVTPRHIAQRGDVSLAWITSLVTSLIIIRALRLGGFRSRKPRFWRRGRDLRRAHFRRSLLGATLRRALKHRDLAAHIARLIAVLRDLDKYAAQLVRRLRRMRRYLLRTTPPIAPAALPLGAPAPPPAFADSS